MRTTVDIFGFATIAILITLTVFAGTHDSPMVEATKVICSGAADVPVVFGDILETESPAFDLNPGEAALTAEDEGVRTTLFGRLADTGAINLFHAFWYDGRQIDHRRYFVETRVFERLHASIWATVDATITQVDVPGDDKHSIRIHRYNPLTAKEMQKIARASADSHHWVSNNRQHIDLNAFKNGRSKPYIVQEDNWNRDFNKLSRRDEMEIRSLDMIRGMVELTCSRYIIEELPGHHAAFIDLNMVYDLKNEAPIRLLVMSNGYFME